MKMIPIPIVIIPSTVQQISIFSGSGKRLWRSPGGSTDKKPSPTSYSVTTGHGEDASTDKRYGC